MNRPLSHGGHFESQENKKLCFCTSSLALDERLAVQNLLFEHCVIKVYCLGKLYGCDPYKFLLVYNTAQRKLLNLLMQ